MQDEVNNEQSCIKWSIMKYRSYLQKIGIDSKLVFSRIYDVIIKTVISFEPFLMQNVPNTFSARNNFYELFGFDILIDQKFKPWLIEVNVCPSLNVTTPIDKRIKTRMMTDLQNLIGYVPFNKKYFEIKIE
jgi:tubulin polyglutamylase TTLL4